MAEWKKILVEGDAAELTDVSPESVGTASAVGTSSTAARSDHVHDLGADVVTSANIADDAVGSEHIETLSADLDFGANAATDFGIETVSSMTASEVTTSEFVGRMVFNNDNSRPYIYI